MQILEKMQDADAARGVHRRAGNFHVVQNIAFFTSAVKIRTAKLKMGEEKGDVIHAAS